MTFRAQIHTTDPKNIGEQFRTPSGLLRNTLRLFLRNEHQLIPWELRF